MHETGFVAVSQVEQAALWARVAQKKTDAALAQRLRVCLARRRTVGAFAGHIRTSVKIYPRAILSTPGTCGYAISYKLVLRVVPQKPLRSGIF